MPDELAALIVGHEVQHVIDLGWRHVTNGKLLVLSKSNGFDVFITEDGNLPYQQNLVGKKISVLVLRPETQTLPSLLALAPAILRSLTNLEPGSVIRVSA